MEKGKEGKRKKGKERRKGKGKKEGERKKDEGKRSSFPTVGGGGDTMGVGAWSRNIYICICIYMTTIVSVKHIFAKNAIAMLRCLEGAGAL